MAGEPKAQRETQTQEQGNNGVVLEEFDEGPYDSQGRVVLCLLLDSLARHSQRETLTHEQSTGGLVLDELDDGLHDSRGLAVFGLLGSGGMGVVHNGQQLSLPRQVALKSVRGDASIASQRELVREARVMALLEHPNIVPIYALRHVGGKPTIVLKKIVGEKWSDRIANEGLEWNIGVLLKVLDAVRFAHSCGILHRDLKPSNVMVGEFGEVYVLDWGSAVSVREEHRGLLPMTSEIVKPHGSASYMAPEMLFPEWAPIAEPTDVYLLGAILYEIVMGRPPHSAETLSEAYCKVANSQPVYSTDLSQELVALLQRSMRREPGQRFPSVDAFKSALVDFLEHRDSRELMVRGQLLLDGLREKCSSPGSVKRDEVYHIYRRCKFSLQESLRTWPENEEAGSALAECGELVVDYELARGEPAAAASLLAELGITDGSRAEAVEDALRQRNEKAAEAEYLRKDADFNLDAGTRGVVMAGIGLLWAFVPLLLVVTVPETSYRSQSAAHLGFLAVCAFASTRGAAWLDSTATNRGLFRIVLCGGLSAIAVNCGSWMMGVPAEQAQVYHLFVFFVCGLATMVTIDWRAWPSALVFFVAFLIGARWPALCLFAMSAGNAVLAANAFMIWRDAEDDGTVYCTRTM